MKLLLDTHVLYWWLAERRQLSAASLAAISDVNAEVFVSVVSVWEMSIKVGVGKWESARLIVDEFERHLSVEAIKVLSMTIPHVRAAGLMQSPRRDPFDRLLAAQAIAEGLTLVTADTKVQGLGATWVW